MQTIGTAVETTNRSSKVSSYNVYHCSPSSHRYHVLQSVQFLRIYGAAYLEHVRTGTVIDECFYFKIYFDP
jgi:hypothetical protein